MRFYPLWTDENNRFNVETIKAIIIMIKNYFKKAQNIRTIEVENENDDFIEPTIVMEEI